MARRTLHRWVFSWLCRWFPGRVKGRRRQPVIHSFRPQLMILEPRWAPISMNVAAPFELVHPRFAPSDSELSAAASETPKTLDESPTMPSENLSLLLTPRPAEDGSVLVRAPQQPQQEPIASSALSAQALTELDNPFARLSARPFAPLSTPPKPLPTPANTGSGGRGIGGMSSPNAGKGGGGPTGGGGGPGLINANQFASADFGASTSTPTTPATPTPGFSYQAAFFSPASTSHAASSPATAAAVSSTPALTVQPPAAAPHHPKPPTPHAPSGHDPLYVIDLNTGETVPANATLNTFASWSENLLAQVSGATVSSYSWNLSQATDLTSVSGTTTDNLQGTWSGTSSGMQTISVTETPTSGSPLTLTFNFNLAPVTSPAYSSSRPTTSSTWSNVLTPDLIQSQQATEPGGPNASLGLADGSVQTSYTMPSYNSNVDPLTLDYASTAADAQPIFLVHYQLPSTLPSLVTAQLTLNSSLHTTVSYNPSTLNPGDYMQIALQSNASGLSTGRYPYAISIYNGTSTTSYSGNVDLVNEASSPYGAGWSLDNVEQLVKVGTSGALLVQPGGSSLWFAQSGSSYTTPAGDFSTLAANGSGYKQTLPDGTQINFNSSGQQTSIVDRDGNTTSFAYTSSLLTVGLLTSITDMNSQQVTLAYNGSHQLTHITDPASRTATLAYSSSGNQLTSITDPAGDVWQYNYLSSGELTKLTDPRSNATTFAYDFAKRVTAVTQADSTTLALTPEQVNGLAASGSTNVTATLLAVDDQAPYTDGRSNVWTTELDWLGFGRDIQSDDPLSDVSFTYRDTNGLPWLSSDALARRTREFFNSQGNATLVVAPDDTTQTYGYNSFSEVTQYTDQLSNLTTYSYNSKGDLTQATDPLSDVTTYAYNSAGLVTSMTDPNSNTTTSAYDSRNRLTSTTDALSDVTTFAYDSASNLTGTTNARGFTTTSSYDQMGRQTGQTVQIGASTYATSTVAYDRAGNQTSTTDPLNHTTTYGFDALNRQTAMTDALGHQTTYGYDADGNQTSVTDALHRMSTYGYDAANRQTSRTDPAGDQTTTAYDAAGEVTSVTDPMGNQTTTTYTLKGLVSSVTDPVGNQTTYGYDAAGNQTSETVTPSSGGHPVILSSEQQLWSFNTIDQMTAYTDAAGDQTTYAYDKSGNQTATTDNLGHQTTLAYDALDRQTSMVDALGNQTTSVYDPLGDQTSVTDPLSHQTTSSYDGANRLTAVTDPRGGLTTYGYDLAGNLTSLTDSVGNQTTYAYNDDDLMTKMTDPLGHAQTYAYDAANQLTSTTDRDGRTTTYAYDQAGRRTGETWVSGSYSATFMYNQDSLLTKAYDASSTYTYAYNADSQVTSVDNAGTSGVPTVTLSYAYDGYQNVTSLTDSLGGSVAYGYNGDNQLTSLALSLSATMDAQVTLGYDAANRLTGLTRTAVSGSVTISSSLSYDNADRLTNLTDQYGKFNTILANYTYGYDAGSELTSYTDNSSNALTYGYDADGQLTSASGTLNGSSYSASYSYDTNGNRTMTGYSTGTGNELLSDGTYSYTYDNNGNLSTQTNISTHSVTYYTWDYRNRLTEVKEETSLGTVIYDEKFTYDVNNNRIGVSLNGTQQLYTVYDGLNPYIDFNGSGTLTQRYLVNPQSLSQFYGQVSAGGTTQWFLTDNINSIRQVVSTSGIVLDAILYDAYGNIVNQTSMTYEPRFLYTGGEYDSNTGTYQDGAREDNPLDGRWESPDPLGLQQDTNPYRYVDNRPTDAIDPSGLALKFVFGIEPLIINWKAWYGQKLDVKKDSPVSYDAKLSVQSKYELLSMAPFGIIGAVKYRKEDQFVPVAPILSVLIPGFPLIGWWHSGYASLLINVYMQTNEAEIPAGEYWVDFDVSAEASATGPGSNSLVHWMAWGGDGSRVLLNVAAPSANEFGSANGEEVAFDLKGGRERLKIAQVVLFASAPADAGNTAEAIASIHINAMRFKNADTGGRLKTINF